MGNRRPKGDRPGLDRPDVGRPSLRGDGTDAVIDPTARLHAEGLEPGAWSNGPHDRYSAHDHAFDKVLVVASGSIRFGLPDLGRSVELTVGDRLDLPAGTRHDAVVGGSGVTCLEAHTPAHTFTTATFRAAGEW